MVSLGMTVLDELAARADDDVPDFDVAGVSKEVADAFT